MTPNIKEKYLFKVLMLALLFGFQINSYSQHDPEFTQYYANPLYLNPAFAGSDICPRVHVNYRNQWPALAANFTTVTASYDQYVDKLNGGVGLMVMSDRQAVTNAFKGTYIAGMYAYQAKLNKDWSLRFGGQAAFSQWAIDSEELTFGDQIHPQRGFIYSTNETYINQSDNVFDFTVGGLIFSDNMYFGTAVHHITQPELQFLSNSKWPMRINAHFGWRKELDQNGLRSSRASYISPNIIYSSQGEFQQLNLGGYVYNNPMTIGLWYRHVFNFSDAVAVSLGFHTDKYRIGYSYDFTVSALGNQASAGAHEISLAIQLECRKPRKVIRIPVCPKF